MKSPYYTNNRQFVVTKNSSNTSEFLINCCFDHKNEKVVRPFFKCEFEVQNTCKFKCEKTNK